MLLGPIKGAEHRDLGHVVLDVVRVGAARVKRMIYPAGFHWANDMKPVTKTDYCMHAHVGFLAQGEIHIEYADGCIVELKAPAVVAIDPGHDGWVVGKSPAVMIEFDFEGDTIQRLGMPGRTDTNFKTATGAPIALWAGTPGRRPARAGSSSRQPTARVVGRARPRCRDRPRNRRATAPAVRCWSPPEAGPPSCRAPTNRRVGR